MKYAHLCPDATIYTWQPIKPTPRACPRDKERIDAPHIKKVERDGVTLFYKPKRIQVLNDVFISVSGTINEDEVEATKKTILASVEKLRQKT